MKVNNVNKEKLGIVQDLLDEMVESSFVAGVNCLVLERGKEVGYYEAGYADLANKKKMQRDTICCLYSMSKPITAAAVMSLIENGKIDLLDPVEKFIPSFKDQKVVEGGKLVDRNKSITIKDLLSMTSGLTYGGIQNEAEKEMDAVINDAKAKLETPNAYTTYELAQAMGKVPLAFQPGTHWNYGVSADILGAVIEVVADRTFGEYLNEVIFKPLEMVDTGFWVPEDKRSRLAKVYEETEEGLKEYNGNNLAILVSMERKARFESGGAGLVSTIDDYKNFAQMLLNKGELEGTRILQPKTVEFMTTSHLTAKLDEEVATWESLKGFSYGNLMRIMQDPGLAVFNGAKGEYGWDGWLGPYFANDTLHDVTFLMMQQKTDTGTTMYTRRLRNVVSAAL